MAKNEVTFICENCQAVYNRWQGRCSSCSSWNTIVQSSFPQTSSGITFVSKTPITLDDYVHHDVACIPTGLHEVDFVLGKGIPQGAAIILGGEPGVGKSTLSLQVCLNIAKSGKKVLYVSAEETSNQVLERALRVLGESAKVPSFWVFSETDVVKIMKTIQELVPDLVVIDSIQTIAHSDVNSISGSVQQVRTCAAALIQLIKNLEKSILFIGHITKDGQLAGPKILEHIVDMVLNLEGEANQELRFLRSLKNRYSSTYDIGLLTMEAEGFKDISIHPGHFIDQTSLQFPGTVLSTVIEGNRVFIIEIQSLVVDSIYGNGKRTSVGVDMNRETILLSVIDKYLGLKLGSKDIMINVVGGIKASEPSNDLALVASVLSSLFDVRLGKVAFIGEIGLGGEIRAIKHMDRRLSDLQRMGIEEIVGPADMKGLKLEGVALTPLNSIRELFSWIKDRL